jgi:hypothetical protein
MKKRMGYFLLYVLLCALLAGCGTVKFGTYIDTQIMPNYQVSAERIRTIAPQFKASWEPVSGFIQGNIWYKLRTPMMIQNIVSRLDDIYIKAKNDAWTEKEQGEMSSLILQLEYEWGKYLYDTYGDTVVNLIKQIAM